MKRFLMSALLLVAGAVFVFVLLPMIATKLLAFPDKVATNIMAALIFGIPAVLATLLAFRSKNKFTKFSAIVFAVCVTLFAGAALTPESVLESEIFLNIGTSVVLAVPVIFFVWVIYRFVKWLRLRSNQRKSRNGSVGTNI